MSFAKPHKLSNEYIHSFSTYTITSSPNWMIEDPFMTNFMNALSITFPDGERFFMKAVKQFANDPAITSNKQLKEDIKVFLAQEAYHGQAHEKFNEFLKRQNYPIDVLVKIVQDLLGNVENNSKKIGYMNQMPLALTCALEHITAIMGELIISDPNFLSEKNMDKHLAPLWKWHALEELEHKAVAYDVYEAIYKQNGQRNKYIHEVERMTSFLIATIGFLIAIHGFQIILMASDGSLTLNGFIKGVRRLYVEKNGYMRKLYPEWKKYFKIGFHPSQIENNIVNGLQKPKV